MHHVVEAYLNVFNRSVRSGDWSNFARAFTEDGVVEFRDVPVPALRGRESIEAGYREAPPDDTITVVGCRSDGDVHEVDFRWDEGSGGGRMRLTTRGGLVARSVISLSPGALRSPA